mgnify:FL=1
MAADLRALKFYIKFRLKFTPPCAHESDLIGNQTKSRALA